MPKIFIACDHAGFDLKGKLKAFLEENGYENTDLGPDVLNPEDDYPDFSAKVSEAVLENLGSFGIMLGGSGQGEAITANRFKGIRAVVFNGQYKPADGREVPDEIRLSREHNDSNVLCLGSRFLNEDEAKEAVLKWIQIPFSGEERHVRRLKKLNELI